MAKTQVQCLICELQCSGEEAGKHTGLTKHNNWELLLPFMKTWAEEHAQSTSFVPSKSTPEGLSEERHSVGGSGNGRTRE